MKTIIIFIFLTSSLLANNDDLSWVDTQIEAIKPPRDGESNINMSKIKNPFIFLKKNSSKKETDKKSVNVSSKANKKEVSKVSGSVTEVSTTPLYKKDSFVLYAIINKTALINGKWYKLGDIVNSYKITHLDNKTVTLKNSSKTKVLSTASKNTKLKFKK
ncbi:hypothetical protein FJR48_04485 [Sulfurimonas lithotrophica]|uniref:Uncharacterized protein n=1 Tax=Sulfurimonas lithotrophica TaxID=2590022 RepID=A0A5P8P097_9BACT|nr:hypothetical protein [Sulfurimonas lithotrophica]QFR49020.1 hypothetical protein FJR48_04485 [Sulfurimonas lithotrophica]